MPSHSPVGRVDYFIEDDFENFPAGHYRGHGGDQSQPHANPKALPDVDARFMVKPGTTWEQRRSHQHRFPKNYAPSDERIYEDVFEYLSGHGDIDLENIAIEVNDGDVILRGAVRSRYARFYAEDLASRVPGVKDIVNELKIERWPDGRERGGPSSDMGGPESRSSHR